MNKRILASVAALVTGLGIFTAAPANAGGSGDFYKATTCKGKTAAGRVLFDDTYLTLSNYDYGTGQQYHFGMKYHPATIAYVPSALYIDGVRWTGSLSDAYKNYTSKSSTHTFRAVWSAGGVGELSCTISNF